MIPLNRASYQTPFGRKGLKPFKPNAGQTMIGKEIIQELQRMEHSTTQAAYQLRFTRVRSLMKQFTTFS